MVKQYCWLMAAGSIKKSGLYDEVVRILKDSGKRIVELSALCQTQL